MRYENEKCSYCGEVFKSDDKIVVCPECGAPHHKSCYDEISKCAFNNLHSEGYVWSPKESDENAFTQTHSNSATTKTCPVCQTENSADARFCQKCRAPFFAAFEQYNTQTINIDGEYISTEEFIDPENTVTAGEAVVYIKSNSAKFIKSFLRAKFAKTRQKFNFAAFFLSPYWFFYRKMYLFGSLFAAVGLAASLIYSSLIYRCFPEALSYLASAASASGSSTSDMMQIYANCKGYILAGFQQHPIMSKAILLFPLVFIAINLVAGFLANKLYLSKIKKDVVKLKEISPDKNALFAFLNAKGGTSLLMVVAAYFAIDLIKQAITMFSN